VPCPTRRVVPGARVSCGFPRSWLQVRWSNTEDLEGKFAAGGCNVQPGANALADEGPSHGCGDRHTAVADVGLDRADELVLHDVAGFEVTDADPAADSCAAIGSGRGDLRGREARFEKGDPLVELCLLLEEVEERRIVGEVAVLEPRAAARLVRERCRLEAFRARRAGLRIP
jgi:hypothetical protein